MMERRVCPFHADDDVVGVLMNNDGDYSFTCDRSTGHPTSGTYSWMAAPEPPDLAELSGLAEELGLDIKLPAAISQYPGRRIEYGVVEHAYAQTNPKDFATLVDRYGHTAIRMTRYSASSFLAGTLGRLSRNGSVLFHAGPATGRWSYNGQISWWSLAPEPAPVKWTSWTDLALPMDYVPGSTERV
jgi:hypothetical protein